MAAAADVIYRKYANAFVPDAEISVGGRALLLGSGSSVDWLRRKMGGLWVGGAVTLTTEALVFQPNALNEAAHVGDTARSVLLEHVTDVRDRFGWLTGIVDVRSRNGETLTFRCFGARSFSDKIRQAVQRARGYTNSLRP